MTSVGSLVIDFIAQTASFNSNITKAAANLNSQAARMNRSLASIQKTAGLVKSSLIGFATGVGVGGVIELAKASLDYAASLGETSQQLGVTTRDLQLYRAAAKEVGIEQEDIDRALAKLTVTIGKASFGGKQQADVFKALGISVRDASGHVKTAGEVIPQLAERLSKINDPARRAAIEVELFGKAGQKLDTLLAGGKAQIDNLTEAYKKFGAILTPEQIKKADDAADTLERIKTILSAKIAGWVADAAPGIVNLVTSLGKLSAWADSHPRVMQLLGILSSGGATLGLSAGANLLGLNKPDTSFADTRRKIADLNKVRLQLPMGPVRDDVNKRIIELAKSIGVHQGPKPAASADDGVSNFLATGGGGGGGRSKADEAVEAAMRLTAEFDAQVADLQLQLRLQGLHAQGLDQQADTEELIARLHQQLTGLDAKRLADVDKIAAAVVAQKYAVDAVKDAQDKLNDAVDKQKDLYKQAAEEARRFAEEQQAKVKEFGDQIGESFSNALEGLITGRKDALQQLVADLGAEVRKVVILDPLKDLISKNIGQPLGKRLGVGSDKFQISAQLQAELTAASIDVRNFANQLIVATDALRSLPVGGVGVTPILPDLGAANDNLGTLSLSTANVTTALRQQIPILDQFGSGLLSILSSLGGGGTGGVGGLFGLAGGLLGGGGGITGSVLPSIGLLPIDIPIGLPKFASGGHITGPGIVGEHGEEMFWPDAPGTIIPAPQTARFMAALGNARAVRGGDTYRLSVQVFGDIPEDKARRTGAQIASGHRSEQARAARVGIAA